MQTPFRQVVFVVLGSGRILTISSGFSSDSDLLLRLKREACFLLLFVGCFELVQKAPDNLMKISISLVEGQKTKNFMRSEFL